MIRQNCSFGTKVVPREMNKSRAGYKGALGFRDGVILFGYPSLTKQSPWRVVWTLLEFFCPDFISPLVVVTFVHKIKLNTLWTDTIVIFSYRLQLNLETETQLSDPTNKSIGQALCSNLLQRQLPFVLWLLSSCTKNAMTWPCAVTTPNACQLAIGQKLTLAFWVAGT